MNQESYRKCFDVELENMRSMTSLKGHDYSRNDDVFSNFRLIETLSAGLVSTETGILTRMSDKLARIVNLMTVSSENRTLRVDESIDDNLLDLAVYAIILRIFRMFGRDPVPVVLASKQPEAYNNAKQSTEQLSSRTAASSSLR